MPAGEGRATERAGKKVRVSGRAAGNVLRMRAHFYLKTLTKLQHNEAHLGIRAKENNVCKCNMASSDGFHLTLES